MKYLLEWKGLDQGVEHTWQREVIIGGLKLLAKHAPVEHRNQNSPFYEDMEKLFPGKKWKAFDKKDGSFRPIFRRSNTWGKLGLTSERDKKFTVTSLGSQLLAEQVSLSDVYSSVFRTHVEGKEKPFVILASLLSSFKSTKIDIDFIIHVLHQWRPGDNLEEAIKAAENEQLDKSSNEYKTRKRRVKSMLKLFSSMECLHISGKSVEITNRPLLLDLCETSILEESYYEELATARTTNKIEIAPRKRTSEKNEIKKFIFDAARTTDPEQRIRLLERAKQGHEDLVSKVAAYFESKGYESLEHPTAYDLYTQIDEETGYLFEIKTITEKNWYKQIREAVSQLHEYNFRHRNDLSRINHLVIVVDQDPTTLMEEWVYDYLENDRNILLMWFSGEEPMSVEISKKRVETIKGIEKKLT